MLVMKMRQLSAHFINFVLCHSLKTDYNLYKKFWSLQDYFRNPNQCYTKIPWKTFCSVANNFVNPVIINALKLGLIFYFSTPMMFCPPFLQLNLTNGEIVLNGTKPMWCKQMPKQLMLIWMEETSNNILLNIWQVRIFWSSSWAILTLDDIFSSSFWLCSSTLTRLSNLNS